MQVLSLFDGVSTGQYVLNKIGRRIDKYFSAEIDRNAITVTQHHFPNTIQLGDIRNINWGPDAGKIDLLIGGSPCKNLSKIGNGKGLVGKDSSLFFEYIRLLREVKPKYFFLENVASMSNDSLHKITELMEVPPIFINSNIFLPHDRKRFYWTNIPWPYFPQEPVIESMRSLLIDGKDVPEKYFLAKHQVDLSFKITSFNSKPEADRHHARPLVCQAYTGRAAKDNIVTEMIHPENKTKYRKLMPIEFERLQGLPDGYTDVLPDTYRYQTVGNGWTVPVIEQFFRNIEF